MTMNAAISPAPLDVLPIDVEPELADEVLEYCRGANLISSLASCLRIAAKHFPAAKHRDVYLSFDPEEGTKSVTVFLVVDGTASEASRAYDHFIHEWADAQAAHAWDRIILSYAVS